MGAVMTQRCFYCDEDTTTPCWSAIEASGCADGPPRIIGTRPKITVTDEIAEAEAQIKSDGGSTDYYKLPEDATELQDLIEAKEMNFSVGNIFKACFRLGEKDGNSALYDIRKIKWFAAREEARLKGSG